MLRNPKLLLGDPLRVQDELSPGLRGVVHDLATGRAPEEALFEVGPELRASLERSTRELPSEPERLEPFFGQVCRKLMRRRVDEKLGWIARQTAALQSASELPEDARRLLEQRVELLALRKKLV